MSSLLEVKNLFKSYGTGEARVEVLKGIDLTVAAGDTIALVGPSGAGKSTLLHVMGTIDRPSSGEVLFDGEKIFNLADQPLAAFRNRSIGFVFQFHHLLPEFSALENVMMPLLIGGEKRSRCEGRALKLLKDVGLSHRVTHRPGELSGGEQQRVAIARALVREPKLLLADEPTGNLDMKTSEEVHSLLYEIQRNTGISLVIVTHNEHLAAGMARTVRMVDGKVVEAA
ncbi:ABC transporter ATP-binding protein [Geomonas sp. Red69]|uniref:ABC transporter ATP-binding protein n=1 Tax=Geomonas diazotrophica TaxID=2843197 RepID=A0ABX8JFH6_9BACT|nr:MULTISPECIES: ABC transporter ATP-binding protein [Geomonas]MBU5638250.1 ABC transporter ATP-binding protein [Geomonas diazotrophica]QWV96741.1 ABC transporter ATP-binding protein [Geomonas nitrogeniifigens]QXE85844.1 ABC transporter ATP-binding protein [Geomonas nitrogeniifigens]